MKILEKIYSNSLSNCILLTLERWFTNSILYKVFARILCFIKKQYQESRFRRFFLTRDSFFSVWFREGFFVHIISAGFLLLHWIFRMGRITYNDSFLQVFCKQSGADVSQNWLRYTASFLYSSFIVYIILCLFFGSGFTRNEMMILIFVIFLWFVLSQLQGDSNKYLENSVILKWIQKIYL